MSSEQRTYLLRHLYIEDGDSLKTLSAPEEIKLDSESLSEDLETKKSYENEILMKEVKENRCESVGYLAEFSGAENKGDYSNSTTSSVINADALPEAESVGDIDNRSRGQFPESTVQELAAAESLEDINNSNRHQFPESIVQELEAAESLEDDIDNSNRRQFPENIVQELEAAEDTDSITYTSGDFESDISASDSEESGTMGAMISSSTRNKKTLEKSSEGIKRKKERTSKDSKRFKQTTLDFEPQQRAGGGKIYRQSTTSSNESHNRNTRSKDINNDDTTVNSRYIDKKNDNITLGSRFIEKKNDNTKLGSRFFDKKNDNTKLGSRFFDKKNDNTKPGSRFIDHDTQDYRNGYPGKVDNPCRNDNLRFYRGEIMSTPKGAFIDEIHDKWWGNYELLESHHGYIQWLFPIRESGMNSKAQPLQLHEAKAIKEDPKTKKRLLKSYKMILDFYGMKLQNEVTGKLERSENWKKCFNNFNRSSHNFLRITRILKCLGELGYEHLKKGFIQFVLEEALIRHTLVRTLTSCRDYWIGTIKDGQDRKELYNYIDQHQE